MCGQETDQGYTDQELIGAAVDVRSALRSQPIDAAHY